MASSTRPLIAFAVVPLLIEVAKYRAQFNTIVQTTSYEELVRRVRARVHELNETPAATGRIPVARG